MARRWKWEVALVCALGLVLAFGMPALAEDKDKAKDEKAEGTHADRVLKARDVYLEFVNSKDHEVPQGLRDKAKAIAVFPKVTKAALGFGGRYGKGVISYRGANGWSAPAFLTMTGGSWGLQIGVESADVILYFMTDESVHSLLDSKFTLGGKAGVAAGPFGRTAEADTDIKLNAEIYSYARSKGLFAGISLEGAKVASDDESATAFYGKAVSADAILRGEVPSRPAAADAFVQVLP